MPKPTIITTESFDGESHQRIRVEAYSAYSGVTSPYIYISVTELEYGRTIDIAAARIGVEETQALIKALSEHLAIIAPEAVSG